MTKGQWYARSRAARTIHDARILSPWRQSESHRWYSNQPSPRRINNLAIHLPIDNQPPTLIPKNIPPLSRVIPKQLLDQIDMREQHAAAAVAGESQCVERKSIHHQQQFHVVSFDAHSLKIGSNRLFFTFFFEWE
jgi:hypothetical protein